MHSPVNVKFKNSIMIFELIKYSCVMHTFLN